MRYGRRWRDGQPQEACPRRIHRFVEPCLLMLLRDNEAHGYELLEGLKQFGFEQNPVDSSTVYRFLRGLEERGYVTSRWDIQQRTSPPPVPDHGGRRRLPGLVGG